MRTKITLACTECKQRNYNHDKRQRKLILTGWKPRKYCRFCKTPYITQRNQIRRSSGKGSEKMSEKRREVRQGFKKKNWFTGTVG